MNDWLHVIWAAGALALAGGALAGYRLSWRKGLVYILMWGCIFTVVTLIINAVGGY